MPVYNGTNNQDVINGDKPNADINDTIYGFGGNDILIGGLGTDTLYGGEGNDDLRDLGDTGVSTLYGGTGNDTYRISSINDAVIEFANEGRDNVDVWYGFQGGYTLTANVEDLLMRGGTFAIGNDLDNTISILADVTTMTLLDGRGGNDRLFGGSASETLLGGAGNDTLTAGAGNDKLNGGFGNDNLYSGSGNDSFVFDINSAFSTAIGVDLVGDFTRGSDKIVLDKTTFQALTSSPGNGFSTSSEFATVTSDTAVAGSAARIVYNISSGNLFYNQNGSLAGLGTGGQFATLSLRPALTTSDFVIQA